MTMTPTLNAYAGVARGHRPRSLLGDSTSTVGVREESVVNYEAGRKGSLAQGKRQWSASVYHYEHFQTTALSLGRFTVEDAGNATGRGFEFGLQGRVSGNLSMFANYANTDATFDDRDDSGRRQQYAGYTFRLTPRRSFSLGATATTARGNSGQFFVTPVWTYKSAHYFEDDNASLGYGLRQGGYGLVNVRAGWRSPRGRWQIVAHASNLLDRDDLIDAGNVGGFFGIPTFIAGDPRRLGLQATLRW